MRGMEPEPVVEQAERGMGARTVGDECRIIRVLRGDELSVYPSHIIPFHIISYHIISFQFIWVWGVNMGQEEKSQNVSEVGGNVDMAKKKKKEIRWTYPINHLEHVLNLLRAG